MKCRLWVCLYVCTCGRTRVYGHVYRYVGACLWTCILACFSEIVSGCLKILLEEVPIVRDRQTDRQTDRQGKGQGKGVIVGGVLSSKVAALKQRLSPYQDKYIAYVLQYCIFESVRGKEGGSNGGRERAQERYAPGSGRLGGDKKFLFFFRGMRQGVGDWGVTKSFFSISLARPGRVQPSTSQHQDTYIFY